MPCSGRFSLSKGVRGYATKKILIINSCHHGIANQFEFLLNDNLNCAIQTVNSDTKLSYDERPDLMVLVGDQSLPSNLVEGVPKIFVACTQCETIDKFPTGRFDEFIITPLIEAEVVYRVKCLLGELNRTEIDLAQKNLLAKLGLEQVVGQDPVFLEVLSKIPLIADSEVTILLTGETGVGKEVFARAIHYLSGHTDKPFVPVNCGAIPENLFENELFGHKKGAFTDARNDKIGLIAEADGGTLFLDEINSLPVEAQSKILRLLQDKTYRPLGHTQDIKANIRVVAATNADLWERVQAGIFREDLFYRLTLNLKLPALRERKSDVPFLANHFLKKFKKETNRTNKSLSPTALQKLMLYHWPGNIRELENVLQHAMLLSPKPVIPPEYINLPHFNGNGSAKTLSFSEAKKHAVESFEKNYLTGLLIACDGNISRAAKAAKKDRGDFSRLVKKYRLDPKSFGSSLL